MLSRKATTDDIEGILALQKDNLHSELTDEQRKKGFVTTPFSVPQIERILKQDGLFVTSESAQVIAYAFAGTWSYFEQWPIFPYMTSRFPELNFQGKQITANNTFQYGPVCIDADYRGKGILNQVFEAMRIEWAKKFSTSVTFINQVNEISTRAHEKLGWEIIDRFSFNGKDYLGLAFDMEHSAVSK